MPELLTDYDRLRQTLRLKPWDWTTRRVLADLYEETGDDRMAQSQRLMAEYWIFPVRASLEQWRWFSNRPSTGIFSNFIGREDVSYNLWIFAMVGIRPELAPCFPWSSKTAQEAELQLYHVEHLIENRIQDFVNDDILRIKREVIEKLERENWRPDHE